jgi:hypothetical protein
MPYFKKINTLFIHIPKTGGTSLEFILKKKNKNIIKLYSGRTNNIMPKKYLRKISLQHQRLKHLYKYRKKLNIKFNKKIKIISIVRNPYTRIISDLFFYSLINKNTTKKETYNIILRYINNTDVDNHNIKQYKFLEFNHKLFQIKMFNKKTKTKSKFEIIVFKKEKLNKQLKKYGIITNNIIKNKNKKVNEDCYFNYLNYPAIKLINNIYHKDFIKFNYKKIKTIKKFRQRLKKNIDKD